MLAEDLRKAFEAENAELGLLGVPRALKKLESRAAAAKKVLSANKATNVKIEGVYKNKSLEKLGSSAAAKRSPSKPKMILLLSCWRMATS
ncbi:hypothetical protein ETH_00033810 [Eimeria tenella]|uniref:Uncharacterized protein n=1 Tax=Eimeria tenella TaxID=5802 RepID=U6KL16_EIMTE|nr:hypothetical protein ETH_00033810 [Eimeria tenella]CDJ38807.1 hypothetical protein ETH_00033810 [Eimeria tenella]|eukprot:XP_013229563.1 hypothetical protein ETH_00033810 [Eimeria tenella]